MQNPQDAQNAQRQMLYQLQYLRQQEEMFQNQLDIVNASLRNLNNTKITVKNLKDVKDGEEILVPIGGMLELKANIKEPQNVLLYVSNDVVIEKNLEDSIEFIDKLIEQHKEQLEFLQEQTQKIKQNLQGLTQTLQRGFSPGQ